MPVQKVSKEDIIAHSRKLFQVKSYYQTSMADIAQACGLLKGSLYHHFPSKEVLMIEVIKSVHQFFKDEVFVHAYNVDLDMMGRLKLMMNRSDKILIGKNGGNVMGNIGVETAIIVPEFATMIRWFFTDWMKALEHVFSLEYEIKVAKVIAEQSVAEIEGAMVMRRIFQDGKYLKRAYRRILNRVKLEPAE